MKTADFLRKHKAFSSDAKWALSVFPDMSDVWDELVKQDKYDWLLWTATRPGLFPDSVLRKLACRFVRETPVANGRTVWDLLTDERSRQAVEVAEAYADGNATEAELDAALAAASAANAASSAAYYAASAAYAAAYAAGADAVAIAAAAAAYAAGADAVAYAAQIRMVAEIGNPFKKGADK